MIALSPVFLRLLCCSSLAAPLAAQEPSERARTLFVANCATCHGESGDGQGTTQLDRPARSFMDGGFSFGNTPEALFKTISVGIPGTPMAGFDASLSEEERELLARYVVTLGPPIEEVKVEDTILAVHARPLVVRGLLPPMADGLPSHPRGLLIGDPSGITFEYRIDDVRLLGLRQGGFVERTDWSGRGGTALNPLGKVVYLVAGGKPERLFSLAGGAIPLEARISGTRVDDGVALDYHLVAKGNEVAHVVESPCVLKTPFGTGYTRSFALTAVRSRVHLALLDPTRGPEELWTSKVSTMDAYGNVRLPPSVRKDPDGKIAFHALVLGARRWSHKAGVLIVDLNLGQSETIALETVPLGEWNDSVRSQVEHFIR